MDPGNNGTSERLMQNPPNPVDTGIQSERMSISPYLGYSGISEAELSRGKPIPPLKPVKENRQSTSEYKLNIFHLNLETHSSQTIDA